MEPLHFLRGLAIGLALAAPIGPVGILCIRRALSDGPLAAFVAGLGAAFADTFFGAVAALGLTVVSSFLAEHTCILRLVGGAFLIVLGGHTFHQVPVLDSGPASGHSMARDFVSAFVISLSNPATILATMGVFAAIGSLGHIGPGDPHLIIAGVFAGSSLWWLILSTAVGKIRSRFSQSWLIRMNHVLGCLLVVSGIAILVSLAVNRWG